MKIPLHLMTTWNNHKRFSAICISISVVIILFLLLMHSEKNEKNIIALQNSRSEQIVKKLNTISVMLIDIEKNPFNSKQQQMAIKNLQDNISHIQKSIIDVANSTDIQKLSNQISTTKEDIGSKINDLKKSLSKNFENKEYLDTNSLPFHVLSVDVIAGQPYVSINYDNHIFPLEIGETLVGWRVYSADYDSNFAEFVNIKNQYVQINLKGI